MKQLSPIDILITLQWQTRFWFVLFVLSVFGFSWERTRLISSLTNDSEILVMSADTFYLPKSVDFESASELHASQVATALETLFNRNPKGLDHPNRLKRLFERSQQQDVLSDVAEESRALAAKQIHQKVEVGEIQLLQTDSRSILASVKGQLIRNGIFDGESFVEVRELEARFTFTRNPDMRSNGGFPTIVTDFEITITPSSS